jgi:hypothetical protein
MSTSDDSTRTHLDLSPHRLRLSVGGTVTLELGVGTELLAAPNALSATPRPAELEHAIDRVEDAISASRWAFEQRGTLLTRQPHLTALPGLQQAGQTLSRDAIEALFALLAQRAFGTPVGASALPEGREAAAALLILRECMHHLGFERIEHAGGRMGQGGTHVSE